MERSLRPTRESDALPRWLGPAVMLAVPVLILWTAVGLLASERFLRWEYARPGFPHAPGLTDAQRLALAWPATALVVGRSSPEAVAALQLDHEPVFTAAEIAHLLDVRSRLRVLGALSAAGLVAVLLGGALWFGGRFPQWPGRIERGGWLTLGLAALVATAVGLAWPTFFDSFHQALFPPGTWLFEADSGLIRLFPERFWFDVAVLMLGLAVAGGGLAIAVGHGLGRLARYRQPAA